MPPPRDSFFGYADLVIGVDRAQGSDFTVALLRHRTTGVVSTVDTRQLAMDVPIEQALVNYFSVTPIFPADMGAEEAPPPAPEPAGPPVERLSAWKRLLKGR